MDLTAKVAALEEEVGILKGEIKTILQELRNAVLARENPFSLNGQDFAPVPAPRRESTPFDAVFDEVPPVHAAPAPAPAPVVMIREVPAPVESITDITPSARPRQALAPDEREPDAPSRPCRWSVHSLAALMTWTKEQSQRFNRQDMDIVLSLARYGGLVDEDLEATLDKLSKGLAPQEEPQRAGNNDFLLALRQLDALLDEATATAERPARRAS